ncbi:hypothetical protein GN958_ATG22286 [Phytophthora infestans]|uniref:Uncharacterized protein n=1 Tax=Phytophthora infestans TaxID=4787 RepID=A0A8S9TNR5_PHYIN|nr:hypothetical protein GN958_ATG22286 [Phytophthora infestans]
MEGEHICGWCGSSECDWAVYGGELQKTAARLVDTLSRKRRRNPVMRAILRRKYIYMKTGSMSRAVPECVRRGLVNNWPDESMVSDLY